MVYFKDSQTWLHHSTLLLEARPTTTRISTRYILSPLSASPKKIRKPAPSTTGNPPPDSQSAAPPSRAQLVLKTYDPVSGTCLKYRTDKAAEVGRLVGALGRCARAMAALPPKEEDLDGAGKEEEGGAETQVTAGSGGKEEGKEGKEGKALGHPNPGSGGGGTGGGGGKKKKGKR